MQWPRAGGGVSRGKCNQNQFSTLWLSPDARCCFTSSLMMSYRPHADSLSVHSAREQIPSLVWMSSGPSLITESRCSLFQSFSPLHIISQSFTHQYALKHTHTHTDHMATCETAAGPAVTQKWSVLPETRLGLLTIAPHLHATSTTNTMHVCAWVQRVSVLSWLVILSVCHSALWQILSCHFRQPDKSLACTFIRMPILLGEALISWQHSQTFTCLHSLPSLNRENKDARLSISASILLTNMFFICI